MSSARDRPADMDRSREGDALTGVVPDLSRPPTGGPFRPKRATEPGRNRLAPSRRAGPQPAPEMVAGRKLRQCHWGWRDEQHRKRDDLDRTGPVADGAERPGRRNTAR